MSGLDFAKAFGVSLLLMVLNVAAAFGVVAIYSIFILPGRDQASYNAAAQTIAPWSSVFVGVVLFFAAGWFFARRRLERNGVLFALAFALIYVALDVAIIAAVGGLTQLGLVVALSFATKLAAATGGARLAR